MKPKQTSTYDLPVKLAMSCALVAVAITAAGTAVSAQTASPTASSAGVLSTSATGTAAAKKKPTRASPDMINEAIQRSEARAAKETATGKPQQWGSEEPFTYNPAQKNFTSQQQ
jgi:hypothetical protein